MHACASKLIRRGLMTALALCLVLAGAGGSLAAGKGLGGVVRIKTRTGGSLRLYDGSYALIIGVSRYEHWPHLESVPGEIRQVAALMRKQGFKVQEILDPDSGQLEDAFENFIENYGYQKENRLVFFYSGHGYSPASGKKGYLVPRDAPSPNRDRIGFRRKALPMTQILAWARDMEAKHSLFLFDSCFSGTVFTAKSRPVPRYIDIKTAQPVRQFITAGSASQEVPAKSVFTPSLIRALEGEADRSPKDGYVSGSELGEYLLERVSYYNPAQTPQYGKIRDPELDQGDFVFALAEKPVLTPPRPQPPAPPAQAPPPPAAKGSADLFISTEPSEAVVYLDGQRKGRSPITLQLIPAGEHKIVARKGYMEHKTSVKLLQDDLLKLHLKLKHQTGSLKVFSKPAGATLYIDGKELGRTPFQAREIPLGKRKIELRLTKDRERFRYWQLFEVKPGSNRLTAQLMQSTGSLKVFSQPDGARLTIDGKSYGKTPAEVRGLETGSHKLTLSKKQGNEYYEYRGGMQIESGPNRVTLKLTKTKTPARIENSLGMEFVLIPAGSFMMGSEKGSDDERPVHKVIINKPFYMQTTEVTQEQWHMLMQASPSHFRGVNRPVENVSWNDVQQFINRINQLEETAGRYRLPTEAEWEYAARATTRTEFNTGQYISTQMANYDGNYPMPGQPKGVYRKQTLPVKKFPMNRWGLYDMHGNVWEWCRNGSGVDSNARPSALNPLASASRMLRGGSWKSTAWDLRSARRYSSAKHARLNDIGFRLVRMP